MEELLEVYKAFADKNRVRILKMLLKRPLCVCELADVIGISQPAISRHLKQMKSAGLLSDQKMGNWVYYRINEKNKVFGRQLLDLLEGWLNDDEIILEDQKNLNNSKMSETISPLIAIEN